MYPETMKEDGNGDFHVHGHIY